MKSKSKKKKENIKYHILFKVCVSVCVCVFVRHAKVLQKSLKFKKQTARRLGRLVKNIEKFSRPGGVRHFPFSPFAVWHFPFPRAPLIIRFALTLRFPRNFSFLFSFLTKDVNNWHCYARDGN